MSDDEDMIMDETNQVCIDLFIFIFFICLYIQSSYGGGDDDDEGTRGSGSRQK